MENIITVERLKKTYGGRTIFNNYSFAIPEKSITAIVGQSGSGKSTLLNLIGLLEPADSGSIKIKGKEIPKVNSKQATLLRRNTINYLFQSFALINHLSVMDNVLLAMEFQSGSKSSKKELIRRHLHNIGLGELEKATVNTLSGGEQQRVALVRCMVKPGNLVLADEPTGSLDRRLAESVFNEIKGLRDNFGKTVVVVTHDPIIAAQADFVIDLSKRN